MLSLGGGRLAARLSGGAANALSRCPAVPLTGVFFMKIAGAIAMAIISRIAQTVRRSMIQFTASGDGIEPAWMKRMTADETASSEPGALEGPVPRNRFQGILRTRWGKPAGRRQRGRDDQLVSADQRSDGLARQLEKKHGSPGTKNGLAPLENLRLKRFEAGGIRLSPCLDDEIPGRLPLLHFPPPDLSETAPQTIAGHGGGLELGDDQSHPRLARWIFQPDHVEMLEPAAPAMSQATANVGRACEPVGSRQARRSRQEPPCFDGIETVSCFRPFFLRRERTARPQRVAMRARKPCLLILRLLRGR